MPLSTELIVIGLVTVCGAISINAQTNLIGKYFNRETIADEELYKQGLDKQDTILELKNASAALLTDISKGKNRHRDEAPGLGIKRRNHYRLNFQRVKRGSRLYLYL